MSLLTRVLLALYPRSVRDRYGEEIADLLQKSPTRWRDLADVFRCGLNERVASAGPAKVLAPFALTGVVVNVRRSWLTLGLATVAGVVLLELLAVTWIAYQQGSLAVAYAHRAAPTRAEGLCDDPGPQGARHLS